MKHSINNYNSSAKVLSKQKTRLGVVYSCTSPSTLKAFLDIKWHTKRLYSTSVSLLGTVKNVNELELSPYWVTGFADAESSFSLKVSKKSTIASGWNVVPEFKIELHSRDLLLLRKIHSFFGIGTIYEREDRNMVYYSVQSARAITNIIIPHFDKYLLITAPHKRRLIISYLNKLWIS